MRLRLGASGAEQLCALGAIGRFCAAPQLHRRSHLGTSGFAKKMGERAWFGSAVTSAAADLIVLQASSVNATGCACGWQQLRSRSGRAP